MIQEVETIRLVGKFQILFVSLFSNTVVLISHPQYSPFFLLVYLFVYRPM